LAIAGGIFLFMRRKRAVKDTQSLGLNEMESDAITNVEIGERIGGGNFGDVYKGTWNRTPVALKKLKQDQMQDFVHELVTLKNLRHPNIVAFLGIYTSKSQDKYIVTEYLFLGSATHLVATTTMRIKDLVAM
jgi:serine/threonine protein kinase